MPLQPIRKRNDGLRMGYATKTHSALPYPAPTKGLDFLNSFSAMDPMSSLVASNVISRSYGIEFRAGWRSWSSLIPGEVRTLMPYNPPRGQAGLLGKLFAASSNGTIYDVTAQTNEVTIPPVAVVIPGQVEPGEFSWTNYTTGTVNYLCICSAGGGYWTYDAVGGWVNRTASIGGAGGPQAINFDFVMSWKNRLWFLADQTADAYYLGVNSISGAAANFDFGPLLVHGGDVKALASWTADAGNGLDEKLVIIASAGDVLIYEGTNPAVAADFGVAGRWFVGAVPNGRRFVDRYGGDLAILCQYGLVYMSELFSQRGVEDPDSQKSYRINPYLGPFIRDAMLLQFWELRYHAPLQLMMINMPDFGDVFDRQFVMDVNTNGWSTFDGIPMLTCEVFQGQMYFGTKTGKVGKAFEPIVTSDGLSTAGVFGKDIQIDVQTAFMPAGDPVRYKRMLQAQLTFQSSAKPDILAQINTDWIFESTLGSPAFIGISGSLWDVALWDVGMWGGSKVATYRGWVGATGIGYFASLRFTGKGLPGTLFINWLLVVEGGGIM